MRYIRLQEEEIKELTRLHISSLNATERMRSQCLLHSDRGIKVNDLCKIHGASSLTIRRWFDLWESLSYAGLRIQLGRGAKKKLENVPEDELKGLVRTNARNLNTVISELQTRYRVAVSKTTLQRLLKNMGI
jgi:transposase